MWVFDIFRKRTPVYGKRRYAYSTGNIELGTRHASGESLKEVLEQVRLQWTPGNEYLWDEFDPQSLIDSEEQRKFNVNQLIYARICLYRALRATGHDIIGRDPFEYVELVPKECARLRELFPSALS
ncbi:MAG: hypothetical protein WCT04_00760 [Planctomycetota bacterium]